MQSLRKLFEKTWHSSQVVKCFVFLRIFRIIFFSNQYCIGCSLSWKRNCYEVHWKFKIIPTLFFYFSFLKTVLLQTFASILTNSSNFSVNMCTVHCVKSEVSKYGVFSGPYFPVFGLNTEIYFSRTKHTFNIKISINPLIKFGHKNDVYSQCYEIWYSE